MSSSILENTRRLNKILQSIGPEGVLFSDLANVLSEILNSNIFIVSRKGRILGHTIVLEKSQLPFDRSTSNDLSIAESCNEELLRYDETNANIKRNDSQNPFIDTIVPVRCGGKRLGTLIIEYLDKELTTDDLVIAEYSATVIGMEIMRSKAEEIEEESRKKTVVQMAVSTLSYSELESVEHIFKELNSDEGLIVASKIADRYGITRSVIVNALRKLESAGVIESRSLGMKGTHIKILNDKLIPELKKLNG